MCVNYTAGSRHSAEFTEYPLSVAAVQDLAPRIGKQHKQRQKVHDNADDDRHEIPQKPVCYKLQTKAGATHDQCGNRHREDVLEDMVHLEPVAEVHNDKPCHYALDPYQGTGDIQRFKAVVHGKQQRRHQEGKMDHLRDQRDPRLATASIHLTGKIGENNRYHTGKAPNADKRACFHPLRSEKNARDKIAVQKHTDTHRYDQHCR